MNEVQSTKVVTGKVRFSYLHVWEPQSIEEGGDKKYSTNILIPKSDKATLTKIRTAIELAKEMGKAKLGGKIPPSLKQPLRDGDIDKPEDETYANCYFLAATSRSKPGIVDADVNPIIDQDELYSGCYGRVSINFYAFNTSGNKGIACGLNNVQKLEDGEPLGGRSTAASDFGENDDLM